MKEKEYFILYLDVLGYKNMLDNDSKKLFLNINNGFRYLNSESKIRKMKCKIFSDNIILGIETKNQDSLEKLCKYAAKVQELFLRRYGIFFRGSIVKGMMYFGSVYIYGKGIIDAYTLEQKVLFPRIVIDKALHNDPYVISSKHTIISYLDNDKFINYMNFFHPNINSNQERRSNLIKVFNSIAGFYNNSIVSSDKRLIAKVMWICNYHKFIYDTYSLESYYELSDHKNFEDWKFNL